MAKIEDKLSDHPFSAFISEKEKSFIAMMREYAKAGVGFGFMQQVIEWEWQDVSQGGAWGPEYFEKKIRDLEVKVSNLSKRKKPKRRKI